MTKNQTLLHTLQVLIIEVAKGKNVGANFALAANLVAAQREENQALVDHFAQEAARMVAASEKRTHTTGARKGQPNPYRAEAVLRGALLATGAQGRRTNANLEAAIKAIQERENHTQAQRELFAKAKEAKKATKVAKKAVAPKATVPTPVMASKPAVVVPPMTPEQFRALVDSAELRAQARAKAKLAEAIKECMEAGVEPTLS